MENSCGLGSYRPQWLQKFANARTFLIVHSILGAVQGISEAYFSVTLTTLEKQYRIRTQTIGIVQSGHTISQALLALILAYVGGQRNRPKWIAGSVLLGSISSFTLAAQHFIFGASDESLQLTKEYSAEHFLNSTLTSFAIPIENQNQNLCLNMTTNILEACQTTEVFSYLPLIVIFFAQFALGIGSALYFSLGQSYLDDSVKMKNTPLLLSYALSLRFFGPLVGFYLGYFTLNIYVDPTKTPLITKKDPRWIGAWWLGWIVSGFLLLIFSALMSLFPEKLPPPPPSKKSIQNGNVDPEQKEFIERPKDVKPTKDEKPLLKDFPKALKRLLTNKVLVLNYCSTLFYMIGTCVYDNYLTKYIEVQFNKTPAAATVFTGPLSMIGMMIGLLASGFLMTKYKIPPQKLYFWCFLCGLFAVLARVTYSQIACDDFVPIGMDDTWSQSTECNSQCKCDDIPFTPVCDATTQTTFFSACHAGCSSYDLDEKLYSNCSCSNQATVITTGACAGNCDNAYIKFSIMLLATNIIGSSAMIGNFMLNLRAVEVQDKALTYGMGLTLMCLFAFIPGPIIFGRIIDSTCLIWSEKCGGRGNCQLYDRDLFKFYVNWISFVFTSIASIFDLLVWHNAKHLNIYGEEN